MRRLRPMPASGFSQPALRWRLIVFFVCICLFQFATNAADLDAIGVTLLRAVAADLDASDVRVAQVEARNGTNQPPAFEVDPSSAQVMIDSSRFSYYSTLGPASVFPNTVGAVSSHANSVAANFFGLPEGVATNVSHVDNFDAEYFYNNFVDVPFAPNPGVPVVNQSFIFTGGDVPEQQEIDSNYDDAAAQHNVLFVSGAGNGGRVYPPSTCYNGFSVGAYGGSSSVGPTLDNGRCKPDITAPAGVTSFSTPQVAGAATLLVQAGLRGEGGADTNATTDIRTLKSLLLNGAVKPVNWTNSNTSPLDARYGAGVLNVFNSYKQLAGGKHDWIEQTTVPHLGPHPPGAAVANVGSLRGWDSAELSSTVTSDGLNHYYFLLTNQSGTAPFTATVTLVWNRQQGRSSINNLDLFLYDVSSGTLVAESASTVDNVEHLYLEQLPPGRYDLQVFKHGGHSGEGRITGTETCALAWEFFNVELSMSATESSLILSWPVYPDGFVLESSPSLGPVAGWAPVEAASLLTNETHRVVLPFNGPGGLFRLRRP